MPLRVSQRSNRSLRFDCKNLWYRISCVRVTKSYNRISSRIRLASS